MQFYFHANQSHFHKNGFALKLALKQRHKGTRKWPVNYNPDYRKLHFFVFPLLLHHSYWVDTDGHSF